MGIATFLLLFHMAFLFAFMNFNPQLCFSNVRFTFSFSALIVLLYEHFTLNILQNKKQIVHKLEYVDLDTVISLNKMFERSIHPSVDS